MIAASLGSWRPRSIALGRVAHQLVEKARHLARVARFRTGLSCGRRAPRARPSAGKRRVPRSGISRWDRASARSCRAQRRRARTRAAVLVREISLLQVLPPRGPYFHLAPFAPQHAVASKRNVLRSMPRYFLPYIFFSWMTSKSWQSFSSASASSSKGSFPYHETCRGISRCRAKRRPRPPSPLELRVQVAEILALTGAAGGHVLRIEVRSPAYGPRPPLNDHVLTATGGRRMKSFTFLPTATVKI